MSLDIASTPFGVRGRVSSNRRDPRERAEIIDGTSNTVSIIAVLIGLRDPGRRFGEEGLD